MKADYLRYIYECLSGDNGLLYGDTHQRNFAADIELRAKNEIASDAEDEIDDDYENPNEEKTLLKFMEGEVISEFDNAKQEIFEKDFNRAKTPLEKGINDEALAPFHPVFLSALMN